MGTKRRKISRKQLEKRESSQEIPTHESESLLRLTWARPAAAILFATLMVWAFLVPADSISVFQGDALPQNLFWLIAAVLCGLSAFDGTGFRFRAFDWIVATSGLTWLVVVTWIGCHENNPRPVWNGFWQIISIASCYFCARTLLVDGRCRAALMCLILVGCSALSIHGLGQVTVRFPAQRARYEADPDRELAKIPLYAPEGSPERARFESRLYSPEPFATFSLANSLATVLSAGLVLALAATVTCLRHWKPNGGSWWVTASMMAMLGLLGTCWFLTRSRTAFVALIAAAAFWLVARAIRNRWKPRDVEAADSRVANPRILGFVFSLVMLILVGGWIWIERNDRLVLTEAPKSLAFRLEYWIATVRMIQDHAWFGVGFGNFQNYYPQYKLEQASETIADPHNWILDWAATMAPVSVLLLLGWLFRCLFRIQFLQDEHESPNVDNGPFRYLVLGAVAGGTLCVALLTLLVGIDLEEILFGWVVGGCLGWASWSVVCKLAESQRAVSATAAVAVLVCLLASGAWQASGIAMPLVALLASGHPRGTCRGSGNRSWMAAVLPGVGLVCFIWQSWMPVTSSWALMQKAENQPGQSRRETILQAMAADRLDTNPLGWLSDLEFERVAFNPQVTGDRQFRKAAAQALQRLEEWLARDRQKFTNWQRAGDQVLKLAEAAQRRGMSTEDFLARASAYYRQAVLLYPSSVQLRAQLAATAAIASDWTTFDMEVAEARRLSEATPHLDKRLESQIIWMPLGSFPQAIQAGNPGSAHAELLIDWLRSTKAP